MIPAMIRRSLIVFEVFLAVTAVAGGIGLLANLNAPSVDVLRGSPFTDFRVPGLALLLLVGGSATLATITLLRGHRLARLSALISGVMILSFELVEVMTIGSPPGAGRNLQLFYGILGLAIIVLAATHRRNNQNQSVQRIQQ